MRRAVLLTGLLLLAPLSLRADALADVRAGLDRLSVSAPVKARVVISRQEIEKEKPKGPLKKGEAIVEHGPSGLSVHLDPEWLPKPGTKSEQKKREESTVRLDPGQALKLVDPGAGIRQLLDGATLVSDRAEPFEGRSVRTVVFRPVPDIDEEDRKSVKRYEDAVTLRLDADGIPVALDRSLDIKVSKMLISFAVTHRESSRFARTAGRLVTTQATEESSSSGLGQSGGATTRWTVTPL
ncbi:MAG TPA: hypothetical protein VE129_13415 [Thermoanaerobaculia bacterium]|nr:hypothetical protein [Thermoanaerobaculia bacterium]